MNRKPQQKRNRLIALSFVSVLLVLVYGPLAPWFVAADRVIYDQLATVMPKKPLGNAYIVSIDTSKKDTAEAIELYGRVLAVLQESGVRRIVMTEPPELGESGNIPGWAAAMTATTPV